VFALLQLAMTGQTCSAGRQCYLGECFLSGLLDVTSVYDPAPARSSSAVLQIALGLGLSLFVVALVMIYLRFKKAREDKEIMANALKNVQERRRARQNDIELHVQHLPHLNRAGHRAGVAASQPVQRREVTGAAETFAQPPLSEQFAGMVALPPIASDHSGSDWGAYHTGDGRPYWFNKATGETAWEDPTRV